jgi:hypothetical protein
MRRLSLLGISIGLLAIGGGANSARALTQPPPSGITLFWNASPDPTVAGYSVYYGPASGYYTNRLDVGLRTNALVSGLAAGSTSYFAATAYDSLGRESIPSNEAIYTAPGILMVGVGADQRLHVTFPANAGHTYEIEASTNFVSWTTISTVVAQTTGWFDIVDTSWTGTGTRFYRIVLH